MTNTINNEQNEDQPNRVLIGERLSAERRRREISVRQISEQIRLPGWVIEALESDRLERVAPLYLRGYIRNYANYLGLDPEPLLAAVERTDAPALRPVLPVNQSGARFERWIKLSTYLLVTTLIVPPLVYFFVVGGVRVFEREVVDADSSQNQSLNVSQRIAEALAIAEPDQDAAESGHMAASAAPLNNLRSLETSEDVLEAAAGQLDEAIDSGMDSLIVEPRLSTLVLELTEDSWIEIESADGQRLEFDLLRAGSQRSYEAAAPFKLLLGRANAVQITLDGQMQQFPGQDRGSVIELTLGEAHSAELNAGDSG